MGFIREYDWEGEEKPAAMVYLTPKLRIRLTDPHKAPVANGKCRLADDPGTVFACDEHGIAEIPLRDRSQKTLNLEWESADMGARSETERFPWSNLFEVDIRSAEDADCIRRLTHLGFLGDSLSDQVSRYQGHFGLAGNGKIGDIRNQLVTWHDGGGPPDSLAATDTAGGADTLDAAPAGTSSKRKRKVLISEHDEHEWVHVEAAAERYPHFEVEDIDDHDRDEILEGMKSVKFGDIYVFEGHTYATVLGGPVEGVSGTDWLGRIEKVTLAEIGKQLRSTPPSVVVIAGCNSNEIFPTVLNAGVRLVLGIENVIRNTIADAINAGIADRITAYLMKGLTIRDAMDKVNTWLESAPLNNGNRVTSDSDDDIDLDLNLEDNGL